MNNRRIVCPALIVFLLFSTALKSQVVLGILFGDKLNTAESIFGIHLDYSLNTLSSYSGQENLNTLNLGLFFNHKLNDNFRGMVELMAKYKRGTSGLPVYDLNDASLNSLYGEGSVSREIKYFSMPVIIQYLIASGIYIETGPQISMRTTARDIITANNPEGALELERDIKEGVRTFDFGWLGGLGYYVDKGKTLSVGIRYYGSFSDALESAGTQSHRQWALYANLPIGRKKLKSEK